MHLVVDQVVQLQHMHVAHGHRALEGLTGTPVVQRGLRARGSEPLARNQLVGEGKFQHAADLALGSAVEHRRREGHAGLQVGRHLDNLGVGELLQPLGLAAALVEQLVEELAQLLDLGLLLQHVADALADALAGPAQMHFEHLAHVHARRHTQGVEARHPPGVPSVM